MVERVSSPTDGQKTVGPPRCYGAGPLACFAVRLLKFFSFKFSNSVNSLL